jgi:amino acid transporter
MEKFSTKFVSIFLATILFTSQVIAGSNVATNSNSENYIDFDETEITNSFEEIDDLVNYISENETATYSDIEQTNSSLLENVSASAAVAMNEQEGGSPLFIGAFFYGCIFSAVGIILVAVVTNNDRNQIKKAEVGCIVSTVALTALYIIYAATLSAE